VRRLLAAATLATTALAAAAASAGGGLALRDGGARHVWAVERIEGVAVDRTPGGGWRVIVRLDADGARELSTLTARRIGHPLAIEVAGSVVSRAVVRDRIAGGAVAIPVAGGEAEARRIAAAILGEPG